MVSSATGSDNSYESQYTLHRSVEAIIETHYSIYAMASAGVNHPARTKRNLPQALTAVLYPGSFMRFMASLSIGTELLGSLDSLGAADGGPMGRGLFCWVYLGVLYCCCCWYPWLSRAEGPSAPFMLSFMRFVGELQLALAQPLAERHHANLPISRGLIQQIQSIMRPIYSLPHRGLGLRVLIANIRVAELT